MKLKLRGLICVLFSILTISILPGPAMAGTPVIHQTAKPAWILPCKPYGKKPSERKVRNGAYDELVEEQVNIEKKATYNHIITQIVSESGVQNNSDISVSFDPSFERLDFHEIIVWRNNKPTSRLNIGAFKILAEEDELDKFIYNGTYSAKYILPDIRKGDRIEYSYTITGRNPIFNDKFCRSIYLQGSDLIEHEFTTLIFSANRKLNMKSFNLLSQPKVTIDGGMKLYQWEDFEVPGVSTSNLAPKWINENARVQVSDYSSWAEVVNWGLSINPIQTSFSGELADTVARLKKQFGNNKEKFFRAAVTLVQDEIRYMGVETGSYSHKANAPANVFKNRYGDCKDKSLLLASILNAGGIEAHMALLNTDLQTAIENFIPSTALFNHAVVVASIGGKQVWVDATMASQGGKGSNIYFPPYGEALILKPGNTKLTKITEAAAGKTTCAERFVITKETSPVKFSVKTTYTLGEADEIRDELASTGTAQTEKSYLDYYAKTYGKIKVVDSLTINDDRENNKLTTTENYLIDNFFKIDTVGKKYTADFYANLIADQLPDVSGQVKTPVSVTYPYDIDYTTTITLPYGWDMVNSHTAITRDAYKFTGDQLINGNDLTLRYQFSYLSKTIPVDKLADFRQDVKNLKDAQLYFSFYYIPNSKDVPFKANNLMLVITALIAGIFIYGGLRIYQTVTREPNYYNRHVVAPPLGGWLIVLVIILFATTLNFTKTLVEDGYFGLNKWDQVTAGTGATINRAILVFEIIGYSSVICYAIFCLVLVFKKRDITPRFVKIYYLYLICILLIDDSVNAYITGRFSNYAMEQILESVFIAICWTYYFNTSTRAKATFVIPYPNYISGDDL